MLSSAYGKVGMGFGSDQKEQVLRLWWRESVCTALSGGS